jgi:hypothetical protein
MSQVEMDLTKWRATWIRPLHMVNVVGVMGSGKTVTLMSLKNMWKRIRATGPKVSIYFQYNEDKVDEFWETIKSVEAEKVFVAIDDISFAVSLRQRRFLHALSKIRHMNPKVKHWVIATSIHYSRATLPFIRMAHTKILTSITNPEEIEALAEAFPRQSLWDFYYVYTHNPLGYWRLVNWLGVTFLTRFIYPKHRRCWDIVVYGPKCIPPKKRGRPPRPPFGEESRVP